MIYFYSQRRLLLHKFRYKSVFFRLRGTTIHTDSLSVLTLRLRNPCEILN